MLRTLSNHGGTGAVLTEGLEILEGLNGGGDVSVTGDLSLLLDIMDVNISMGNDKINFFVK